MAGKCRFWIILAVLILGWVQAQHADSGIYDRIGIIAEHGLHGAVPEENIDLFTGNLTLRFKDIVLPGPNGFDLVIWRVYNSKILRDRFPGNAWGIQQEPYSWVGLGWSMHMGRLHNYNSSEPTVEFPDGRWETAYINIHDTSPNPSYITRDFLKYDKTNSKLYFKDGTVWTFDAQRPKLIDYAGSSEQVLVVKEITNSFGHKIDVEYQSDSSACLRTVTDSMGRSVNFTMSNNRLYRIAVKNATGSTVYYYYTVGTFSTSGYYKLTHYDPPEIPASTYEYEYEGSSSRFELSAVNTSFGGRMEYDYEDHTFYFLVQPLYTRVVTSKKIRFSSSGAYSYWYYDYPDYYNSTTGTVEVDGPVIDTYATYHACSGSNPFGLGWMTGLLDEKWITEYNQSEVIYMEQYEWIAEEISSQLWLVLNINLGTIKAPLLESVRKSRKGDAESIERYYYESGGRDFRQYGLPLKILFYGGTSGTTLKSYKNIDYYFEGSPTFLSKYMLDYVKGETEYSSSGTWLKGSQTEYSTSIGECGAIDYVKRYRTQGTYLTWDYDYSSFNPNDITISVNLPGTAGTESHRYRYGVLAEIEKPGYTELSRGISSYNSAILSETNQHGGTMYFYYDDLGRVENIITPTGFNNIIVTWSTNEVDISQGNNTIAKYWDGMGRDTGYTESGDGISLYFRKNLDAEGRVISENKGSTSSSQLYSYLLNAAGQPTRITDPIGNMTTISYSDDYREINDGNGHRKTLYYENFPGLPSKLNDPRGRNALYTYDSIGRLTGVDYNNSRTQTYEYNCLDQVIAESHPETGAISYTYNAENNLASQTWEADHTETQFTYNNSNQLTGSDADDETINYSYDSLGRLSSVSGSGWARDQLTYNSLGAILKERIYIQGLPISAYKIINYTYDKNNNLASITYPDGRTASYTNNGLNTPETLAFNSTSLITQVGYGINKQPTSISFGNSTGFSASYQATGWLSTASLKKGSTTLYQAQYDYDGVGNITDIFNTVPAANVEFTYDSLDRLTEADYASGKWFDYTYDDYGNLLTARKNNTLFYDRFYNSKNQIDNLGFDYDPRGNLTQTPYYSYSWDNKNRLEQITHKGAGQVIGSSLYDERGLRVKTSRMPGPIITITTPAGGETWYKNFPYAILWTYAGFMDANVKIQLFSGTIPVLEIIASTPNNGLYTWAIPALLANGSYTIQVQTLDGQVTGQSDSFTITDAPSVTVTSPNGSENWETASIHDITWTSQNLAGNVQIEYSTTNGATWTTIASSTINDGVYPWAVPYQPSNTCLIRVSETDGDPIDSSDAVFSIVEPASLTILSPNGGEAWETGSTHNITWTDSGSVGNVKIEYSLDNGSSWSTIESSTANDYSYTWVIPDNPGLVSDRCLVRITDIDNYPTDTSSSVFSIVLPPAIFITSPNGGETWEIGDYHQITWTSQGLVGNVKIDYSTTDGAAWKPIVSSTPNDGGYPWYVPIDPSTACLIRISETDGDPTDESNGSFSIVRPMHIKVLSPNGGETLASGTEQEIAWTGPGIFGYVRIDYSLDNGSTWIPISIDTPDDGGYTWTIPDTPSISCLVRVGSADADPEPPDTSNAVFIITSGTSTCGETWKNSDYSGSDVFNSIAYGNGLYVAVGNSGVIWTSTDTINWTPHTSHTTNILYGIAYGNNTFTAAGQSGIILTSPDGTSWTARTSNTGQDLRAITYNDNRFIAVGGSGTILTSQDGITWADHSPSPAIPNTFYGIVYGNDTYVTVGSSGKILTSPDAINWTSRPGGTAITLYGIAYSGSQFAAVGDSGTIITSPDSVNWTHRTSAVTTRLSGITFDQASSLYVIIGHYGEILTSLDGIDWTRQTSGSANHLFGVGNGDQRLVAVGTGKILYSLCGPLTASLTITSPNGGENWAAGNTHLLTWTSTGTVGDVKLNYSIDSGYTWIEITASTPNDGEYEWLIPDNPAAHCLVQIGEIDGDPQDTSDMPFSIFIGEEPGLTLISPNGGETLTSGEPYSITWISTGTVGNLCLEYSIDSGTNWRKITGATANDGIYDWNIPDISITSGHCLVRISENDTDRQPTDTSNNEFTILSSGTGGALTLTSPNGREILTTGMIHQITWISTGTVGTVKIEYSIDSGLTWATLFENVDNVSGSNSVMWTVPNTPADHCLVRIGESNGDRAITDTSDAEFSIVSPSGPALFLLSPNGGEQLTIGSTWAITWDSFNGVGEITLEYSIDNGSNWVEIISGTADVGAHDWIVPGTPSNQCLVRTRETNGSLSDTSNTTFSIVEPPSLIVTSPNGGETWEAGTVETITWAFTGDTAKITNVKIEYSTDNGTAWSVITASTANDGSHNWIIPNTPSSQCRIRISDSKADNSALYVTDTGDAQFTILPPASPSIRVASPNGGERLQVGSIHTITWESFGIVGEVKIEYSIDSGNTWIETISATGNDGSHEWAIPDNPSETCLIRVGETDGTPLDTSDNPFAIVPPSTDSMTVVSPNGGENLTVGTTHNITWTASSNIENITIEYSIDNGANWIMIVASTTNNGNYDWVIPNTPADHCLVRIGSSNPSGEQQTTDTSDNVFSIINPFPSLTITSPNGGEGLIVGTVHTVTWTGSAGIAYVDIEYSIDKGNRWRNITSSTVNDGCYNWTVPDTPSDQCLVRIVSHQGDDACTDVSDCLFSIVADTPLPCGAAWQSSNYTGNDILHAVTYGNSMFVAVGEQGQIMTGTDGINWTNRDSGITNHLYGICYGIDVGRYAAVGAGGRIITSPDGIDWTRQTSGIFTRLNAIAYGINRYVAVGDNGTILTGTDGLTWEQSPSGVTANLQAIVFGNGKFVAVGANGTILTSPDGIAWNKSASGTMKALYGIGYGNDTFVAVGESGIILTGTDGDQWNSRISHIDTDLLDIAYGNLTFAAVGRNGKILTGIEGETWTGWSSGVRDDLSGVCYGNRGFSAVGSGTILYSLCQPESGTDTAMNGDDKICVFGYNLGMEIDRADHGPGKVHPGSSSPAIHGPSSDDSHSTTDTRPGNKSTSTSPVLPQTGGLIATYYIWGYNGKLLAEYDQAGICSREYIYAGIKLIAEYQPQTGQYYYYMSDQVNSSRLITDSTGDVVYSAGYEPFGAKMTTWIDTYDPQLKFSGKERESYTNLDYFGARYYDNPSYRFLSPDPVMNKEKALANPQYWNLYAYCGNNPINFIDFLGLDNYVFYDPSNFSKQANVEAGRLKNLNGEATHSMPIRTENEFKTAWSGMEDPTDVTLLFHSGGGAGLGNTIAIDARNKEYLVTNPSGRTPRGELGTYIGSIFKKSIKNLNLYICHSADYTVKNNIASTFFKTQDVDTVRGVQGAFNYNRWYMLLVLETPWYAPRESNQYVEYRR